MVEILSISDLPIFQPSDNIGRIIFNKYGKNLKENDILVIAHTIVSRVENCEVKLENINPSDLALQFSKTSLKDPKIVEVVLQEAKSIVRMSPTLLITETKHGFICANSGVDQSNARPGYVLTLPKNPDKSATLIRSELQHLTGLRNIVVIISDTFGRPFRIGTTNVAIGIAGLEPIRDYSGSKDLFGYELQHTNVAVADELACAAGLVMGQANEGTPIIIIRGFDLYSSSETSSATDLNRKQNDALFW